VSRELKGSKKYIKLKESTKMNRKAIRHGDLCLVQVKKIPEGLQPSNTNTLMQGSGGNNHDVKNGIVYLKDEDEFVFGYMVALPKCQLLHPDHGAGEGQIKTANIPEGSYELRRQFEQTHDAMRQVVD